MSGWSSSSGQVTGGPQGAQVPEGQASRGDRQCGDTGGDTGARRDTGMGVQTAEGVSGGGERWQWGKIQVT